MTKWLLGVGTIWAFMLAGTVLYWPISHPILGFVGLALIGGGLMAIRDRLMEHSRD